ncbi:MAG: hypothetical protein K9N49_05275 [Candidatus Marinimicrobia bacterium]|nr:hypothetical protein [Candidatus Neomarinimicrobiota bacterium]
MPVWLRRGVWGGLVLGLLCAGSPGAGAAPLRAWREYPRCTLIAHPGNDGDSFHVKAGRKHYLFRVYFVDTPETSRSYPERIADQAAYFEISEDEVIQIGHEAAEVVAGWLASGPFVCHTRLVDARGHSEMPRHFAMVRLGDRWLAERLVEAGLARIYGLREDLPDGTSARTFLWRLKALEREAQRQGRGAWRFRSASPLRPGLRAPQAPAPEPPPVVEPPPLRVEGSGLPGMGVNAVLRHRTPVYSLHDAERQVGILQAGARVVLVGPGTAAAFQRLRFQGPGERVLEAQCLLDDLDYDR